MMRDAGDIGPDEKFGKECDYGERCYRKNPTHFKDYEHQHLNVLLQKLGRTGLKELPKDYVPKISKETTIEQLNILKNLKTYGEPNQEDVDTPSDPSQASSNNILNCSSGSSQRKRPSNSDSTEKNVQLKKASIVGEGTSHQDRVLEKNRNTSEKPDCCKTNQKEMTSTSRTLSSEEHRNRMQKAQNMSEALEYFKEVKNRSQGNILEKHRNSAPYNFFLTSVTDSKKTHTEPLSLQMFDILDPSLGDLESSLQINFMVEFGWLMAQYQISNQGGKPMTLLYGEMDVNDTQQIKHVTAVNVKCPSPFGSHHTKMCVLAYRDGSVRLCVHTANLVESDWDNRVQGVWLSPVCPALSLDADSNAGESPTHFKQDLIQYLSAYRLSQLQPWIGKLRRADFSLINVFFVASVPGSHKGVDANKWGHAKLRGLLQKHVQIPPKSGCPPSTWQIIAQCSSIGSLGPEPTSWFCGEIKHTMSGGLGQGLQSPPPIRLVYPTFNNVAASYDGLLGGGCLPYSQKTHTKQTWLHQYMYQWKCDARHRTRAVPHIKTYCRVSPDLSQLAWFHLTSANLSKAAWGSLSKAGAISILSYEAGVLFLPKFVIDKITFPIKKEGDGNNPTFPMPYDLPLTQFSCGDVPWFSDVLC